MRIKTQFPFMAQRRLALAVSSILVLLSLVSLATRGLVLGIDFTGGTLVEVAFQEPAELSDVSERLQQAGLTGAVVQHLGGVKDVLVRLPPREQGALAALGEQVLSALQKGGEVSVTLKRIEFVGPQVGDELTQDGGLALLWALGGILAYVALRFRWQFALGSVVALLHDITITLGVFSVLGLEFNLTILAAVLAVIGYSLNDTIVVFDRIRENFHRRRKEGVVEIINAALNETLSRTLITSGTTLMVVFALFIYGGDVIHGFALALLVGIGVGTYSSLYVASPVLLALRLTREDMREPVKEGAETP